MSVSKHMNRVMKIIVMALILGCLLASCRKDAPQSQQTDAPSVSEHNDFTDLQILKKAFTTRQNNLQVKQHGEIIRILSDDTAGSQHQRCIVKLSSGQTLLIAHNIDLAPRVPNLRMGEPLTFYGEYEWNEQGGVVHWTHQDPDGRHLDGWLKYQGKIYQ